MNLSYFNHFLLFGVILLCACTSQNSSVTNSGDCKDKSIVSEVSSTNTDSIGIHFEISVSYPHLSLDKADLLKSLTISDLDSTFKKSWIDSYISVQISASLDGTKKAVVGYGHDLTIEQRELIKKADTSFPIHAKIMYIPNNSLSENDPKKIEFTVEQNPEINAEYPGGYDDLISYLKENAIDKIADGTYTGYDMSALTFTVTTKGDIENIQLVDPFFKDKNIETLLVNTLTNMPKWEPAMFTDGTIVNQNFAFVVGNMLNCKLNLLKLRKV